MVKLWPSVQPVLAVRGVHSVLAACNERETGYLWLFVQLYHRRYCVWRYFIRPVVRPKLVSMMDP
jgi:hypothetical protein